MQEATEHRATRQSDRAGGFERFPEVLLVELGHGLDDGGGVGELAEGHWRIPWFVGPGYQASHPRFVSWHSGLKVTRPVVSNRAEKVRSIDLSPSQRRVVPDVQTRRQIGPVLCYSYLCCSLLGAIC